MAPKAQPCSSVLPSWAHSWAFSMRLGIPTAQRRPWPQWDPGTPSLECRSQIYSLLQVPMGWDSGLEGLPPPFSATLTSPQKEKTSSNTLSQLGVLACGSKFIWHFFHPTFLAWPHSACTQGLLPPSTLCSHRIWGQDKSQ